MSHANRNQLWARTLVDELVRGGVETVLVSPGSRSTPLVLACAEREELDVLSILDERSAGFFALGVGKGSGVPAAVVTTSGTAVANLLPAVVEASASEVPLLLLTADRPPHLRGADANQTVDQPGIFGAYVRELFDLEPPRVEGGSLRHVRAVVGRALSSALGVPAGPVHLNVPFEKPLEPTPVPGEVTDEFLRRHARETGGRDLGRPWIRVSRRRSRAEPADVEAVAGLLGAAVRGLVVAGPTPEQRRVGRAARRLSAATGFPLLADPMSGARWTDPRVAPSVDGYDLFLREPRVRELLWPEIVLRVGAAPTSASLLEFLDESAEAHQIVVDDGHRHRDHLDRAGDYVRADPAAFLDVLAAAVPGGGREEWTAAWLRAGEVARETLERELEGEPFEGSVLRAVAGALPGDGALFVSNSMPVRDLDTFVPGDLPAPGLRVWGNRGASGIDGVVSSALGISRGIGERVVAVVGDVAFHHDSNGLLAARDGHGEVTFVVIHNDGGGIFHMLPVRAHEPPFQRLFATPHGLDFARQAELYDLPFERAGTPGELADLLSREGEGSRVVEIAGDRESNRRRHLEVEEAVRAALVDELEAPRRFFDGDQGDQE